MLKKRISAILSLLMILTLLAGCGAPAPSATDGQQASGEKIIRISQSPGGKIDPGVITDYTSCVAVVNMYDSLVYPDLDNKIVPSVAKEWKVSPDGLEWTFTLNQGIKFHDGSELKASDVVFSANRLMTIGEGFAYLFKDYLAKTEAVDDYTVKFTLSKPFAPFLSILPRLYILNEDLVKSHQAQGSYGEFGDYGKTYLAENDAGSGAYTCSEMKVQDKIVLKKFKDYFGTFETNAPDIVEIIMNTEPATIRTMMTNKQLDISDQWQTDEAYSALDKINGVDLGSYSNGTVFYLMLNTKKAPTDDVHIRRALAYVIDYAQVTQSLFPGYVKADSVVPKGVLGYTDEYKYDFNLEKAKEELKQSKYANSLDSTPVEVDWIADVPDEEKLALLIQATAQQIGLKVNVVKVPWATHVDNVSRIESTPNATTTFVSSDYSEAGALLYQRFHSDTASTWQQTEWLKDSAVDTKIKDALTTTDETARASVYKELQKEAYDSCWGIPVAEQAEKHAYYDYIKFPAMERAAEGKPVSMAMGYNFLFRTFAVNK
ncbi:ABC-type dipeptide transport system, periplasmic component [Desulfosporosinus orientis DSM 765]|uniref:ABC-type dipeptide transport system, periplasmic component n=1 Tax=Desulfosporosinus orientis (strain ATCC 19365 / DSM 765 / NCIMB 8382 / VKM B-1628 / Singapore I) TaxID=768706 RepID=G7WGM4_DESOD|nr:ABC transporter substrate-binding protein [Desulfosporosinus orientis]AET68460.1 ABC-type dipeptide transport system, periplasmic component [Desulfosporosinus orientis DSM 765]